MTKEPTVKRRSPLEDYLWPIFVAACGNCCVACKATGVTLQRGHVQRHADSGPATLENLMPLCAQCNGKNNKSFNMSDTRPVDWRSNFLKLLAQNLRLKLMVNRGVHPSPKNDKGVQGVDQQNSLHSKEVVAWDAVIFETNSELYTPIPDRPSLVPLAETLATMQELVRRGAHHTVAIPPPKEKCQDKLKRLIAQHGSKDFMAAGVEFVGQERWFDDDGRYGRRVMHEPWQVFADNFAMYLVDAKEQARRRAIRAAEDRAAALKNEAEQREREAKERWLRYLSVGKTPVWPEITDDDSLFIAEVTELRSLTGEVHFVSDEDFRRADDILTRYHAYQRKHPTKKQELLNKLTTFGLRIMKGEIPPLGKEASQGLSKIKQAIMAAHDNAPELDEYYRQLIALARVKPKSEE